MAHNFGKLPENKEITGSIEPVTTGLINSRGHIFRSGNALHDLLSTTKNPSGTKFCSDGDVLQAVQFQLEAPHQEESEEIGSTCAIYPHKLHKPKRQALMWPIVHLRVSLLKDSAAVISLICRTFGHGPNVLQTLLEPFLRAHSQTCGFIFSNLGQQVLGRQGQTPIGHSNILSFAQSGNRQRGTTMAVSGISDTPAACSAWKGHCKARKHTGCSGVGFHPTRCPHSLTHLPVLALAGCFLLVFPFLLTVGRL